MNILIVGNGFDLSHYLPTKYDHFMLAMKAIEDWKESQGEMGFDDLFSSLYEKETYFFGYTKAMYKTDETKISVDKIKELKGQLKENVWYQYFSDHVREVKNWIDFEQKIEEVLVAIACFIADIDKANTHAEVRNYLNFNSKEQWKIKEKNFNILSFFGLWADEEYVSMATIGASVKSKRTNLNTIFCHRNDIKNGFNPEFFLELAHSQLEKFIEVFNLYLELIVDKLIPICNVKIEAKEWILPDKIYSFNYTNTYQKFYAQSADTDFLHGRFGKDQNIVLGVSELQDESLKKLKAYGFTKYHQKLFKDTDYLFLDSYKNQIRENLLELEKHRENSYESVQISQAYFNKITQREKLDLNFFIWGHSLDVSDRDYIVDLFSLNDGMDRNVRVTIYYFDKNAKFSLLNNLLTILEKDKAEQWMKNEWLKFEPNPHLAELNKIQPVELPKIAKA